MPVSEKKPGESPVYRNPNFKDQLLGGPSADVQDMKTAMLRSCAVHPNNNALGTIIRKQGEQDSIKYITYREWLERATAVGSGIIHENLAHQPEGENLKFVGIFSRNRPEWTTVDFACLLYKMTTIPLYDTLGD